MKRLFAHVRALTQCCWQRGNEMNSHCKWQQAHFVLPYRLSALLLSAHSPLGSGWAFAAVVYNRISHPSHPVGIVAFALFRYLFILVSFFFSVWILIIYICVCVCVCVGGRVVFWLNVALLKILKSHLLWA